MELKWTKWALKNLDSIAAFISLDSPNRAREFVLEIYDKTKRLRDFPSSWRPGRVIGTRELVAHARYVVIYRARWRHIEILRIQHTAMGA